jgi:hypothetical protein
MHCQGAPQSTVGPFRPSRRTILSLLLAAAALVLLLLQGSGGLAGATGGDVLRAASVCEAQELKALKEEDPDLEIEIPEEFDRLFPTIWACRSHQAAWDATLPGPIQPIPFSHAHHSGRLQIDCLYCHTGADRLPVAGMPSVEVCMGCHLQFPPEYDSLEGIRILKQHWEDQLPISWVQVHRLPEHVQFRHNRHMVAPGVTCQSCHGLVEAMDKLFLVADTKWWQYGLPTKKLEMGWCVICHRASNVSTDCLLCHY